MGASASLRGFVCGVATLAGAATLGGAPAGAVSAFDGRVEVHGYYEAQIRSLVRDFRLSDDWDLSQWWNVLNLEIEANLAPNGFGPFDVISVFGRIEVRYDCVWTGACTMFDSANAYAFSRYGKLPKRLIDSRRTGYQGTNYIGDRRSFYDVPFEQVSTAADDRILRPDGSREPMQFWQTPIGTGFFSALSYGADGLPQTADDLGFFYFADLTKGHCQRWGARSRRGPVNGRSTGDTLMLDPACDYESIGANRDKPNPFRSSDFNPLIGANGSAALPYRPAPEFNADSGAPLQYARGVYYPNYRLQQLLADDELTQISTKFSRGDLAWNRGQSQQDQKELKELYADIEMFQSQLWLRIGYQTIVWGKTELFRNQDQFNPQDIGLSSLASLEESRISLWALRAIWSFYDVGPVNDVRLEIAANYDQWQSIDPGQCGEPYAPLAVCGFNAGLLAHGYLGIGLAGIQLPPDPWDSWQGIEVGARLEFRWDRFSFAITDFYGFQDFPYVEQIFSYSRNVDPISGRPRHTMSTGRCRTGDEPACLDSDNALTQHPANQQLFAVACAASLAVAPDLDPTACLANIFGSPNRTMPVGATAPRVVVALNMVGQGDVGTDGLVLPGLIGITDTAAFGDVVQGVSYNGQVRKIDGEPEQGRERRPGLRLRQRDEEQHARRSRGLRQHGRDLLHDLRRLALRQADRPAGSAARLRGLLQDELRSRRGRRPQHGGRRLLPVAPQRRGHLHRRREVPLEHVDRGRAQPGTVGFQGAPFCTRYENGRTYVLPGCRGPGDPGYNPRVDGTTTGLIHPFTGQQFKNELAALSWNVLMGIVGFSLPPDRRRTPRDPRSRTSTRPTRSSRGGCSFRRARPGARRGGGHRPLGPAAQQHPRRRQRQFGRRDFVHHSGGMGVLQVDKSNVLGFSMDFAEDVTKSNWGIEFTWVEGLHVGDNDEPTWSPRA